jgi:hypothetical protein
MEVFKGPFSRPREVEGNWAAGGKSYLGPKLKCSQKVVVYEDCAAWGWFDSILDG